jgi:RNA polymerase sigma-70 factor (ECF subfamily)
MSSIVTELLDAWKNGDQSARDKFIESVYGELHRLAESYLRGERDNHTLQPTALVNEAYLKLFSGQSNNWENREHFIGVAAGIMRHVLVDYARARQADKRGGNFFPISLSSADKFLSNNQVDLIELDDVLKRLAEIDELKSRIVELKFFGGLTIEETAHALDISQTTVERGWRMAKAWLRRELGQDAT